MSSGKIAITGASGQLGMELQKASTSYSQFEFVFLTRKTLPIDRADEVFRFMELEKPTYCINCAAYTAVDKAEGEKDLAFSVNAGSVGILAEACKLSGTRLVHLSTDYVFDGHSSTPLKEDDPTSPINIYGASKLMGEQLAFTNNPQTVVIRTSWVYSEFGQNFVKTMIKLMSQRESVSVINDQIGSPTYAGDLAKVILQIINSKAFVPGLYHYSNEGEISWYEFALAIKELIHSKCQVNSIPAAQYPTLAQRPAYSLLDKSKITNVYQVQTVNWKSSLIACINIMQQKGSDFS